MKFASISPVHRLEDNKLNVQVDTAGVLNLYPWFPDDVFGSFPPGSIAAGFISAPSCELAGLYVTSTWLL